LLVLNFNLNISQHLIEYNTTFVVYNYSLQYQLLRLFVHIYTMWKIRKQASV